MLTNGAVVTLSFPNKFAADTKGSLFISFDGVLNDKLVGFYRSKYVLV